MALTVRVRNKEKFGGFYLHRVVVDWDSSYPTGGEPLTSADLDFADHSSDLIMWPTQKGGLVAEWDGANAKLKAYWNGDATPALLPEVTNTTNLSAIVGMELFFLGRKPE